MVGKGFFLSEVLLNLGGNVNLNSESLMQQETGLYRQSFNRLTDSFDSLGRLTIPQKLWVVSMLTQIGFNLFPWRDNLPDCPCSIPIDPSGCPEKRGAGKGWSSPAKTGHKGGSWEIRSAPNANGSAQQCVYDAAGKLINEGSGAGTPDIVSLGVSKIGHFLFDVVPWALTFINYGPYIAECVDHKFHPPNIGKDSNGKPYPPNNGAENPPIGDRSKCCKD